MFSKLPIRLFIQLFLLISQPLILGAQVTENDSLSTQASDTLLTDTIKNDSIIPNSILSKDAIESKVNYKAKDSTRFDLANSKLYLYGEAEVYYENITLKAALIEVDLDSNIVFAVGVPDSSGKIIGSPVFKDGDQEFNSSRMTYNFKTKKGKINEVITQDGDGYLHGKDVKKTEEGTIFIKGGKYTTCSLPHPHFSISSHKLKVIPGKKIVTGPAVLVIEDVPTPLGLPFGIFPNSNDRASGIVIPDPGESTSQGFFLRDGGYYFGFSDKIDMEIGGDIYSKGSYALRAISNYKNKYHFNGNFNVSRSVTKNGVIREDPNYSERKDFFVTWKHQQDPKARPNSRFSANVNVGTQSNFQNNLNTTTSDYLSNTFNSNISYNKSFAGKPFTLALSARHTQNSNTGIVNATLPDASFNVQRIYPFKTKKSNDGWLQKIGISSTLNAKNDISVHDSLISNDNLRTLAKDFRYGVRNTSPINTNIKLLKYFSLSPSINTNQVFYYETIRKVWTPADTLRVEEVSGFESAASANFSANLSTTAYGLFQFRKGRIKAIRHKVTPNVGFTYTPENRSGIRSYVEDTSNKVIEYSIFEQGIYRGLDINRSGKINLGIQNNLEMKVATKSDTGSVDKKIKILENLAINTAYDVIADSLKLDPIVINGRTYIAKNVSLNFGGTIDPYALDSVTTNKVNRFYWDEEGKIGRLTNASIALAFNLKSPTKSGEEGPTIEPGNIYDPYIDFDVPWSLNFNYKLAYSKPRLEETINQTLGFNGDLSLTEKWKVGFVSGYDFDAKDLSYTTLNIYRDLHCWEMSFNWIPTGIRQSYTFTIKVKSSVLQDLKWEKRNLPQTQF